jgi:glycosyltransferase involved in cell wall biosynthesis
MKVLFLMIAYPDVSESSNMYTDLVEEFVLNHHQVFVVAPCKPDEDTHLAREGITQVLRVKTLKLFNVNLMAKGLANLLLPFQFGRALQRFLNISDIDLIVVPTPPITFLGVVKAVKAKSKAKTYLILRDIFPQNAADLGLIKSRVLFNYFRSKEKLLYRASDYIGCMSPGNIEYVKTHNPEVEVEKLCLLPNWQRVLPIEENGQVKQKYGLGDKFVVIFGGNLGEPQQVENIAELAECYRDEEKVVFLVMGKGTRKQRLLELVAEKQLSNILIKDTVLRQDYQALVQTADVGLISLNKNFTIPNIPSKTLSYFNAKIPIFALLDANTDYGKMLTEIGAGLWCLAGQKEKYRPTLDTLYKNGDIRKKMGQNGYNYLLNHLTPELTYKKIIEQVSK